MTKASDDSSVPVRSDWIARRKAEKEQLQLIRQLREDWAEQKEKTKAAKQRIETAVRDLEHLIDERGQGILFPGTLVVDPTTGEITDYQSPGDDGAASAVVDKLAEGLQRIANSKNSGVQSISLQAGDGEPVEVARRGRRARGPRPS